MTSSVDLARGFGYWICEFGSYLRRSVIKCVISLIWNVVFGLLGIALARFRNLWITQQNESFEDYITQGNSESFPFTKMKLFGENIFVPKIIKPGMK